MNRANLEEAAKRIKPQGFFCSYADMRRCMRAYETVNGRCFPVYDSKTIKASKVKNIEAKMVYYYVQFHCELGPRKNDRRNP